MQNPVYKFYPGQIIYIHRDVERNCLFKTHVVHVFDDIYPNGDSVKVDDSAREGINIITLEDISKSLINNPPSLEYLKKAQSKMDRESGNSTEKSDGDREE